MWSQPTILDSRNHSRAIVMNARKPYRIESINKHEEEEGKKQICIQMEWNRKFPVLLLCEFALVVKQNSKSVQESLSYSGPKSNWASIWVGAFYKYAYSVTTIHIKAEV